jgi:poly-gamma-glutamate synthesis protein (capsule biosynthesis protein)
VPGDVHAASAPTTDGEAAEPADAGPPAVITLVVSGDVGLNRNNLPVDSEGVLEGGGTLAWADMTAGIADLIDGDLNFMNLETVVTDRNDLRPGNKGQKSPYLFRTHPRGVAHLVDVGFNLISAANNHSYDYGSEGIRETVKHLAALAEERGAHFAGVGLDRDQAARPALLSHRGARIAFSAIGIVTNMIKEHRAGAEKPGSLGYRFAEDWELAAEEIGKVEADLKLLSIHYGKERRNGADAKQLEEWRWAAREKGVDVVIGHHAHVVRGVEMHRGKLIFYGLGNFLIRGARDMGSDPKLRVWGDFGLLAKVYLVRQESGRYAPRAVIAVPVWDMHRSPRRLPAPEESRRRIEALNSLAAGLDDPKVGSVGVRFRPREDGSGLFCAEGAESDPDPVAALCRDWSPPEPPPADVARIVQTQMRRR